MIPEHIFAAIWFFLPAAIANATPVVAMKLPLLKDWKTPMDLGATFRGQRVFGSNKTWRGLGAGAVMGGVTASLQFLLTDHRLTLSAFLLGALMGFGALTGDAIESFFKRQRGVAAGHSWFPFDQTDYIIGGLAFVYPFTQLPLTSMLFIFVCFFGLHLLTVYVCYLLGIRDKPI